jgi:AraC-like DNA-binding protein
LHDSGLLQVHCVCCRPQDARCGALEHAQHDTLALPLRGVFVKHHESGAEVVAGAGQALFFNAGEDYRVSHPASGGDDCLTLQLSASVLQELLQCFDVAAAEREARPFRATHAALPNAATLQRLLLWRSLNRPGYDVVEIETRSLELFATALAGARPDAAVAVDRRPLARRRRREQARATAVTLAAQPEEPWTLERLAQRVHASPFHLARSFQRELGTSIHQYLLRARLAQALVEVLDSDEELTRIALRLGFSNPSHFSAAFRGAYGVTPSTLRKRADGGELPRPAR